MDWENERFVKLYTRNTPEWVALGWDAQNLLMQLFRVVDRSGVLDLGAMGAQAVAVVLYQVERWETQIRPALDRLVADGCVVISGSKLILRNFLPAQEARMSNRLRQAEFRARRRSDAMGPASSVTDRYAESRSVSDRHDLSTSRNEVFRPVTTRLDETRRDPDPDTRRVESRSGDPNSTPADKSSLSGQGPDAPVLALFEPKRARSAGKAASAQAVTEANSWVEWFNREFGRKVTARPELVKAVEALLRAKFTQRDMRLVALLKRELWGNDPRMRDRLVPLTILREHTFGSYLDQAREFLPPNPTEEIHG